MEERFKTFIDFANQDPREPRLADPNKRFVDALKDRADVHQKLNLLLNEIIQTGKIPDIGYFKSHYYFTSVQKNIDNKLSEVTVEKKDLLWFNPDWFIRVAESFQSFLSESTNLKLLGRCPKCKKFFLKTKDDKRHRFCSDGCRNLNNQESRKTDEGRKKRAEYMVKYHKVVKALRDKEKKKEKAAELKKQTDRENAVEEAWDTLKESQKPER